MFWSQYNTDPAFSQTAPVVALNLKFFVWVHHVSVSILTLLPDLFGDVYQTFVKYCYDPACSLLTLSQQNIKIIIFRHG